MVEQNWERSRNVLSLLSTMMVNPFPNLTHGGGSGSVVECLTRGGRAAGSSLTGVTVLWSLSKTDIS